MDSVRDKKMTTAQIEKMLEMVEQKPELWSGRVIGPDAKARFKTLWDEVAAELNILDGGPIKTGEKWQKAWADWRSKTRLKVRQLPPHGSTAFRPQLSELELKLVALFDTFGWSYTNICDMSDGKVPAALENERERKITPSQKELLLELMQQRPELAAGRGGPASGGWAEVASALNDDTTGPSKSADKWQKAWIDWKSKTRIKVKKLQEKQAATGRKLSLQRYLTVLEYKLAALMGWRGVNAAAAADASIAGASSAAATTADASEDEHKFVPQSSGAAATSSDEWPESPRPPRPPVRRAASTRTKFTAPVRKRARTGSPSEEDLSGEFLRLEREKVTALRDVATTLAALRGDLRSYFNYCINDETPLADHKQFTQL